MKTLTFLLASFLPLFATPENPLIPDTWFQEITATDGSTQQCIIFTTVPGVEYTFYHSDALETWTEIGKTYGLGQQFSAAMRETAPPPPPADPDNPPAPGPVLGQASITIKPSSAPAGGTVVSWPSLDHGNAVQYLITGTMATAWGAVPLFADTHGTHQFFISHTPGNTAPPTGNPILGTKDTEMIADLEAAWTDFNTAVKVSSLSRGSGMMPRNGFIVLLTIQTELEIHEFFTEKRTSWPPVLLGSACVGIATRPRGIENLGGGDAHGNCKAENS